MLPVGSEHAIALLLEDALPKRFSGPPVAVGGIVVLRGDKCIHARAPIIYVCLLESAEAVLGESRV